MNKKIYIDIGDRPFKRMLTVTVEDMGLEAASDISDPEISLVICDNRSALTVKKRIPCLVLDYEIPKNGSEYLLRPFEMSVLCKTIGRLTLSDGEVGETEPTLMLNEKSRSAVYGKKSVELTAAEFKLLSLLYARRGSTVSDGEIACGVWGKADTGGSNITAVYVNYLRKKLLSICGSAVIERVRGEGYRMTGEKETEEL